MKTSSSTARANRRKSTHQFLKKILTRFFSKNTVCTMHADDRTLDLRARSRRVRRAHRAHPEHTDGGDGLRRRALRSFADESVLGDIDLTLGRARAISSRASRIASRVALRASGCRSSANGRRNATTPAQKAEATNGRWRWHRRCRRFERRIGVASHAPLAHGVGTSSRLLRWPEANRLQVFEIVRSMAEAREVDDALMAILTGNAANAEAEGDDGRAKFRTRSRRCARPQPTRGV